MLEANKLSSNLSLSSENDFVARFLDAARAANSNFNLSPFDRPLLPKLESLLQGKASAMEAAARLNQLVSVRELCSAIELDPKLALKLAEKEAGGGIELAWLFLGEEKRLAILRLAVFPASFSREAAEKVMKVTATELSLLSSRSMLSRKGPSRYELNPRFKSFLAAELASRESEAAEWRAAHAQYFSEKLASLRGMGGEELNKVVKNLNDQALDLTQACAFILPGLDGAGAEAQLGILSLALRKLGYFQELADFLGLEAVARLAKNSGWERFRARRASGLSLALLHLGRYDESLGLMLENAQATRNPMLSDLHEEILRDLASSSTRLGPERAAKMKPAFLARLDDCRKSNQSLAEAEALHQLGQLEDVLADTAKMRQWLEPAMEIFSRHGNTPRYHLCLGLLADRCMKDGDAKEAKAWGMRFLADAEKSSDRVGLIWSQLRIADVELLTGETSSALLRLSQSLRLSDSDAERWNCAYFNNKLGEGFRLDGQLEESARVSTFALEAFELMNDVWGAAWSRGFLGHALFLSGRKSEGRAHLEKAAVSFRKQKDTATLLGCLVFLGEADFALEGPSAAWPSLREALGLAEFGGYKTTLMEVLAAMAAALHAASNRLGAELASALYQQPSFSLAGRSLLARYGFRAPAAGSRQPPSLAGFVEQIRKISL